jgi:hypothetical protein
VSHHRVRMIMSIAGRALAGCSAIIIEPRDGWIGFSDSTVPDHFCQPRCVQNSIEAHTSRNGAAPPGSAQEAG